MRSRFLFCVTLSACAAVARPATADGVCKEGSQRVYGASVSADVITPAVAARPRIAIIGSGISGLSLATLLIRDGRELNISIYERSTRIGGHLSCVMLPNGDCIEHCPRVMSSRFTHAIQLLRSIPDGQGANLFDSRMKQAGTLPKSPFVIIEYLFDTLRPWQLKACGTFKTMCGYLVRTMDALAFADSLTPFVALKPGQNERVDYSADTIVGKLDQFLELFMYIFTEFYVLEHPSTHLIMPWVEWLRSHGVNFHLDTAIDSVTPADEAVLLNGERFDLAAVAANAWGTKVLLDSSHLAHTITVEDDESWTDATDPRGVHLQRWNCFTLYYPQNHTFDWTTRTHVRPFVGAAGVSLGAVVSHASGNTSSPKRILIYIIGGLGGSEDNLCPGTEHHRVDRCTHLEDKLQALGLPLDYERAYLYPSQDGNDKILWGQSPWTKDNILHVNATSSPRLCFSGSWLQHGFFDSTEAAVRSAEACYRQLAAIP